MRFLSHPILKSFHQESLPIFKTIPFIYSFKCQYDAEYKGKTIQHLETRISQYVPSFIKEGHLIENLHKSVASGFAIAKQMINNCQCTAV